VPGVYFRKFGFTFPAVFMAMARATDVKGGNTAHQTAQEKDFHHANDAIRQVLVKDIGGNIGK
jgi:hypothetical protein